uniref:DDE Tnp4 domain-containing protein n=1 Tax=Lates calcarifer TaxID=8187 RepID=A0A4W6G5S1_LATCA
MLAPLEDLVDIGARIVRDSLRRARVFRDSESNASSKPCVLVYITFATRHFMYSISDAEHLSKNTICHAIWRVVLALSKLLDAFVVFLAHLSVMNIKEVYYVIAGVSTTSIDGLLVGDRKYPCLPYLMTPYTDPQTTDTAVRIEMTFGVIKAQFACLQGLRVPPERACEVVAACVVLHNIATVHRERAPCQLPMPPDIVDPVTLDHPTGRTIRAAISNQVFK